MTNLENSRAGCGGALAVPAQVGGSSASAPGSPLRGVRNDEFGEFAGRLRGALAVPAQVGGSSASAPGSPLRGVRNDESLCCCPVQRRVATLVSITKLSSFRTRRSRDPEPNDFSLCKASERSREASIKQRVVQIVPIRVLLLHKLEFPLALPSLDGFLASNRGLHG